jgi:hypothetical protein
MPRSPAKSLTSTAASPPDTSLDPPRDAEEVRPAEEPGPGCTPIHGLLAQRPAIRRVGGPLHHAMAVPRPHATVGTAARVTVGTAALVTVGTAALVTVGTAALVAVAAMCHRGSTV